MHDPDTLEGDYNEAWQRHNKWWNDHYVEMNLPFEPPKRSFDTWKNLVRNLKNNQRDLNEKSETMGP